MRPARSLLIFTVIVFAGGALIAPWLYWLAQSFPPQYHLAEYPFRRFVERAFLGLALLGLWPLLRSLGAKSAQDLGLFKPSGQWKLFAGGFALGCGSLAVAGLVALATHARRVAPHFAANEIPAKFTAAAATAVLVAVLEEILFRGAIFGALRKIWNWRTALLVSSMIYAIVHFLQKADLPGPVTWTSGFRLLILMLNGFTDLHEVIPGLFNLTLVGILLGLAYQRTGNLYFSIGLHAGWIFWIKFYGYLTAPSKGFNNWLWGTEKITDGWLGLVISTVTLLILLRLLPDKPKSPSP